MEQIQLLLSGIRAVLDTQLPTGLHQRQLPTDYLLALYPNLHSYDATGAQVSAVFQRRLGEAKRHMWVRRAFASWPLYQRYEPFISTTNFDALVLVRHLVLPLDQFNANKVTIYPHLRRALNDVDQYIGHFYFHMMFVTRLVALYPNFKDPAVQTRLANLDESTGQDLLLLLDLLTCVLREANGNQP